MNWSRAKTVLIIIFLITDIFLAVTIYSSNKKALEIPEEIINSTVSILNRNNIMINKDIIPQKNKSLDIIQAENVIKNYDNFAKSILGDECKKTKENHYESDFGYIDFTGDTFCYVSAKTKSKNVNKTQDAKKTAENFLKNSGIDVTHAKISVITSSNTTSVEYTEFLGKLQVFSSNIKIENSGSDVIKAFGSWFNPTENLTDEKNELKSTAGLLIDFMNSYDGELPCSITALETGYYVYDKEIYHKAATLIPTEKITVSGGKNYFLDSRKSD